MLNFIDKTTRREFLRVGGVAGLAGLSLPAFLAAKAAGQEARRDVTTGKSVIFLMMQGGPSQHETWDPKLDGPSNIRSATGTVQTTVPGLHFGGTFPRLARHAHKLAVVRSYQAENGNHDIKPIVSPHSFNANLGSLYSRVVGPLRGNGMPTNTAIFPSAVDPQGPENRNRFGNFLATGALGTAYTPFVPGAAGPVQQNMRLNIARERLDNRRELLAQIDGLRRQIDGSESIDRFNEQAYDVILSGIGRAFDLSREDPRLVAQYDTARFDRPVAWAHKNNRALYSTHARYLGKQLLLARRLCEAGAGFVLVNTEFVWDMHQDQNNLGVAEGMDLVGTPFDHAVSTFLEDVDNRGLSDQILLVATGEMGRTPNLQGAGGRNHWGRLTSLLLAGGGITRGQVIGQSTRDGGEPARDPQRIPNLNATIMNTLFNASEARLTPGIPTDILRLITETPTIPGLFS